MKKSLMVAILWGLPLLWVSALFAQITPEELAQQAQWEDFLKTAKVVGEQQLSGEEAVTNPWKLTLQLGDFTHNGLWKNAQGRQKGYIEGCLIANDDRSEGNVRITKDWRMILIDHSRTFRPWKKLLYTEKHPEGPKLMSELPRAIVEKTKALTFESIKGVVGDYLTDEEIKTMLVRRDLILAEIDKLIKKNGEANVLY